MTQQNTPITIYRLTWSLASTRRCRITGGLHNLIQSRLRQFSFLVVSHKCPTKDCGSMEVRKFANSESYSEGDCTFILFECRSPIVAHVDRRVVHIDRRVARVDCREAYVPYREAVSRQIYSVPPKIVSPRTLSDDAAIFATCQIMSPRTLSDACSTTFVDRDSCT